MRLDNDGGIGQGFVIWVNASCQANTRKGGRAKHDLDPEKSLIFNRLNEMKKD
ncbi:hypothetical protein [Burkholderia anthina]|uniref:Uncharacterized protein n=1 Tax=Burkholderia anthina TaxID=179879 RepID=A0ABS2B6P4_9BURK|nr:hypothetical protein [Burkholderia anthina]MBM2768614.1 hypothetical protein [Burkholderia anthina]